MADSREGTTDVDNHTNLVDVTYIPLRAHDGSVRAYAVIDSADAPLVAPYRWHLDGLGYAATCSRVNGKTVSVKLHRLLLGLDRGNRLTTDHINRDRLDNRRTNLRILPKAANGQNLTNYRSGRSAFRGVSWESATSKWLATITINGKQRKIGRFADEAEAARAAREARARLMPFAVD